jgi:hypothetical protein
MDFDFDRVDLAPDGAGPLKTWTGHI